jgi:hypothetical protein
VGWSKPEAMARCGIKSQYLACIRKETLVAGTESGNHAKRFERRLL